MHGRLRDKQAFMFVVVNNTFIVVSDIHVGRCKVSVELKLECSSQALPFNRLTDNDQLPLVLAPRPTWASKVPQFTRISDVHPMPQGAASLIS